VLAVGKMESGFMEAYREIWRSQNFGLESANSI